MSRALETTLVLPIILAATCLLRLFIGACSFDQTGFRQLQAGASCGSDGYSILDEAPIEHADWDGSIRGTLLLISGLFHMETPAQYREFAEECDRLARQTEKEGHRKILEEMAETWRKLAAETDGKR